jgi:hypothetical protein
MISDLITQKWINDQIKTIWAEHTAKTLLLNQLSWSHSFEQRRVLFMGINPSHDGNILNEHQTTSLPENIDKGYFRHYYDFAKMMGINREEWTYQDLFYFRQTDQDKFPWDNIEFVCAHLRLSQSVIESINPSLIVVCNSATSNFFGVNANNERTADVWMGYEFGNPKKGKGYELDLKTGAHRITGCKPCIGHNNNEMPFATKLSGTYVFFTSFNQYKSSVERDRTGWHLKNIYDQISK